MLQKYNNALKLLILSYSTKSRRNLRRDVFLYSIYIYTVTRNSPTQPKAVINKKISKTYSISPKKLTESLLEGLTCDNAVRDIWQERNAVVFLLIIGLERKENIMIREKGDQYRCNLQCIIQDNRINIHCYIQDQLDYC
ncbi:Hypothetical_protein [Hexamita inflata]|uniref:Hypothetical_protein n=1 Tax=Hexamita inflata TaxID=28002 RepID=A0AA86RMQ9_9EUKA|nr:Hypothetical protein HINF_LOCUS65066 [Hexamita inflata]